MFGAQFSGAADDGAGVADIPDFIPDNGGRVHDGDEMQNQGNQNNNRQPQIFPM